MLLLHPENLADKNKAIITDLKKITHIRNVLKKHIGDTMDVGLMGGKKGQGVVKEIREKEIELEVDLKINPAEKLPLTLIIALPRPKVFLRTLFHAICLGVEEIHFINAYKVEKPYWSADQLKEKKIKEVIELALEQSEDTVAPGVFFQRLFKPFAEDVLPLISCETDNYVADTTATQTIPMQKTLRKTTIAIGPEGGWLPYEVDLLKSKNFTPVTLGKRTLRVDTAVCAVGGLFLK